MAATVKGTAHLFGVSGTVSNLTVLKFDDKEFCNNVAFTEDESGNVIERRYDDVTIDATLVGRIRASYTRPAPGSTLVYDSVTYEVVDSARGTQNKGFREITIALKKSAGISYA